MDSEGSTSTKSPPDLLELLVLGLHPGEHHAEHLLQARFRGILVDRVVGAQMHLKTTEAQRDPQVYKQRGSTTEHGSETA